MRFGPGPLDLRWRLEAEEDAQRFHQADPSIGGSEKLDRLAIFERPFPPGTVTPNAFIQLKDLLKKDCPD